MLSSLRFSTLTSHLWLRSCDGFCGSSDRSIMFALFVVDLHQRLMVLIVLWLAAPVLGLLHLPALWQTYTALKVLVMFW